ncbi:Protoporphyrinogen oxidase [Mycena venus]|uniref:Protoporphyrinogen oxidase n=1 Tax=Mycena venus TaxID=2733690 RepID=A0A8H6YVB9_9AGAR|nr:Protoporphyrinogen oxidase [Mycena venus]
MEPLASPPSMNGVPMFRNDSEESADSPYASVLNTPADEKPLIFDTIDAKLLSVAAPQALEHLETHVRGRRVDTPRGKSPRRVSPTRQFLKAMYAAYKSTSPTGRSNSVEPTTSPERFSSRAQKLSPDLISFAAGELLPQPTEEPLRVQTPEPPVLDAYTKSSPESITRTTPRNQSTCSIEFTPRAHSTLRRRKGPMFMLLNDSITGKPASQMLGGADASDTEPNDASHEAALADELTSCDYDCPDNYVGIEAPALSQLSLLFPVQLFLLPMWCALVGAAILLFPAGLNAIAFPGSVSVSASVSVSSAPHIRVLSLVRRLITRCAPIAAPPTPILVLAHWATVAHLHIMIFVAFLVGIAYLYLPFGVLLAAASAGQFFRAWGDFSAVQDQDGELELGLGGRGWGHKANVVSGTAARARPRA